MKHSLFGTLPLNTTGPEWVTLETLQSMTSSVAPSFVSTYLSASYNQAWYYIYSSEWAYIIIPWHLSSDTYHASFHYGCRIGILNIPRNRTMFWSGTAFDLNDQVQGIPGGSLKMCRKTPWHNLYNNTLSSSMHSSAILYSSLNLLLSHSFITPDWVLARRKILLICMSNHQVHLLPIYLCCYP